MNLRQLRRPGRQSIFTELPQRLPLTLASHRLPKGVVAQIYRPA